MAPRTKTDYLNITGLTARGWTAAMIRDFLGRPDATAPNPRFHNAPPTPLFARTRIDAAERTRKFAERRDLAARRSASGKAAARRRRMEMLRLMAAEDISIPHLDPAVLEARAVRHRDARARVGGASVDRKTLNRWKVNYLRQHLTRYDPMIEGLFGRIGRADAERSLLRRTFEAIAKAYPDLHDECQRQLRASERRG
ncbi:hypothetical protein [Catenulispora subtropica]|uniref:Uncharacterized protein n=1 Tax=Catenulispora subtropica TaxID=450798 RepID=A0ABP5DZ82_9ACTN